MADRVRKIEFKVFVEGVPQKIKAPEGSSMETIRTSLGLAQEYTFYKRGVRMDMNCAVEEGAEYTAIMNKTGN